MIVPQTRNAPGVTTASGSTAERATAVSSNYVARRLVAEIYVLAEEEHDQALIWITPTLVVFGRADSHRAPRSFCAGVPMVVEFSRMQPADG